MLHPECLNIYEEEFKSGNFAIEVHSPNDPIFDGRICVACKNQLRYRAQPDTFKYKNSQVNKEPLGV